MMHDVILNVIEKTIPCLDKGFVTLLDCMPRLVSDERKTADEAVVQAARVSYGLELKSEKEDKGLIRYLMRHRHTSPFEMIEFKFNCKMPIFVARQWVRHRMASINEISGRYAILEDEFYFPLPEEIRKQSTNNKQGSDGKIEESYAKQFSHNLIYDCGDMYAAYQEAIAMGVGKEMARMKLPLNLYTNWIWKIDLKNLLDFLALRCDSHAQYEIRVYADAILGLIKPIVPWTIEAWEDYNPMRGGLLLTKLEVEALQESLHKRGIIFSEINSDNKRESEEWLNKIKKIERIS